MRMSQLLFMVLMLVLSAPVVCDAAPPGSTKDGFDEDARFNRLGQDERSYILGLQYLMNCFQWKQYLTLPTRREREEWIERFWLYLDPTPTTPENERRIEHEMRVATVRQHFAMGRDPGWDRRGEIFIRFGDPDSRTIIDPDVSERGAAPPREQWYYGTFDMLVSFADITHNGEYFYDEEIPYSIHSILRATTDPFAAYNFSIYPFEMIPMIMPDLKTPKEEITEIIEYCHEADIRKERLPAFVDVTTFRGGPGMLKTEISFEIPGE
ncbi:MAG TPA: GWxTD domain-containing protein, partial [Patescibacteria group bacterium]|nr:GWxTD domain-containing protein [Patescibacteria group bacterium]